MKLREPCLPMGWYPRDKSKIEEFLVPYSHSASKGGIAKSVIAPHAGWYYSGSLAALAISSLEREADTVVVIGGHLSQGMPILIAIEDGVKTPLGNMEIDSEFRKEFEKQMFNKNRAPQSDKYEDNTVEVLLPMIHYFFPRASLLWLRFPAEISSYDAGKLLSKTALDLGRSIVVLASVDLTHYGDNYGFAPNGRGKTALDWVKNVNDASLIDAVLDGDPSLVLKRAEEDYSCCSAGAILGAMGHADSLLADRKKAKLLKYATSADISGESAPASFVGYAAISLG